MTKWDIRYLALARHVAQWSKDPSTRVGAVLVGRDSRDMAVGYNGFPRGIADDDRLHDRKVKYKLMMHAERNVLNNAKFWIEGSTLYCTMHPCLECAKSIISCRVVRIVVPPPPQPEADRWTQEIPDAQAILVEAGVEVDYISE